MSDAEAAWVAGFLEGEGYFGLFPRKDRPKPRATIAASSTDLDVVESLARIVGAGNVTGPYDKGPGCKEAWTWRLGRITEVADLCRAIYPWMGDRRRTRIRKIMDHLQAPIYVQDPAEEGWGPR